MSKRLRPAFAVTEAAVALTADEKVAHSKASLKNVTEEFFSIGDYRCHTVVEKSK
jgi:hypothetical protein